MSVETRGLRLRTTVLALSWIFVALTGQRATACVNGGGTIINGISFDPVTIPDFLFKAGLGNDMIAELVYLVAQKPRDWQSLKIALDGTTSGNAKLEDLRAIVLMRLGRAAEAVTVLKTSESKWPNRYETAANLGTAYELAGDLVQARRWIQEGIARNSEAHHGTEWLHVRILDARLAVAEEPTWLKKNSITGLKFGNRGKPRFPDLPDEPGTIKALEYQLRERMTFVAPPDAIVGDMLFDLANLASRERTPHHTLATLHLARSYAPKMHRPLAKRIAYFERAEKESKSSVPNLTEAHKAALKRTLLSSTHPTGKITERIVVEHVDPKDLARHLTRLIPTAKTGVRGQRTIQIQGMENPVREAKALVKILDQPGRSLGGNE